MKKFIKLIFLMFILSVCSCKNQDLITISNDQNIISEHIITEYDINLDFPISCFSYKANKMNLTKEQLYFLFNNTQNEIIEETPNEGTQINLNLKNKHGIVGDNTFIYYTDYGTKYDDSVSFFLNSNDVDGDLYIDKSLELKFKNREDTLEDINNTINGIGLISDSFKIENFYALKKESFDLYKEYVITLAEEENDEKIKVNANILKNIESQDFYFIDLSVKINEIPVYSEGVLNYGMNPDDSLAGTKFSIIYTEKGIEYLVIMYLYETTEKILPETKIIDFITAQNLLNMKYNGIFLETNIHVHDVELLYMPLPQNDINNRYNDFILTPYYVFYCKENFEFEGDMFTSHFKVCFNAFTGKEL